ncbi:MAG TPA: META domain-containing protein [Arachnia sp.]|mgnify:CR=1 FL=1|nr:META domain-containing protein [Arachnia sp.]HMT85685.1 META domain-containing protein [Arachnia sp.]
MRLIGTLGAAAVLLLAACTPAPDATTTPTDSPSAPATSPASTEPVPDAVVLSGTSWEVTSIESTDTVAEARPTLSFTEDRFTGHSGCNGFGGSFTQDGGTLALSEVFSTEVACLDDAITAQETQLYGALQKVAGVQAADEGAELTDAAGAVVLVLAEQAPVVDLPLEGTLWTLTGIATGDTVSSPVGAKPVTLTISGGALHAQACNVINGEVTVDADTLTVGPLVSTRMACESEEEMMQEGQFMAALESASSYSIDGAQLTLVTADGSVTFTGRDEES